MATEAANPSTDIVYSAEMLPVKTTGMQAMASKMWIPFIGMGIMIIVVAFIYGLINSGQRRGLLRRLEGGTRGGGKRL